MPISMTEVTMRKIAGFGGVEMAVHEVGAQDARPLLLLHGLFSSAHVNWIKYGQAATIAAAGYRVIMPDFRVHGQSDAPHDPDLYPQDVLALDIEALVEAIGLEDFDLGGFSLGARTAALLLSRGLKPRRAVLAGMGLQGLSGWGKRRDFFLSVIDDRENIKHGDPRWLSLQFMKTMKVDTEAAKLLLGSFGGFDTDALADISMPVLVVAGDEDQDNGSPQDLAAALPDARFASVPGTHMSSVTKPELGRTIADFLNG